MRMTHTLVKLSVASAGHGWVVTAINLSNVVALDVGYLVHCQVAGKGDLKGGQGQGQHTAMKTKQLKTCINKVYEGYSEVISEGQQLSPLVFEVVDKLGVFSILPRQCFLRANRDMFVCEMVSGFSACQACLTGDKNLPLVQKQVCQWSLLHAA